MHKLISCIVLSFVIISPVYAHTSGGVEVKGAWVREAPPSAKVLAAYMHIQNHTGSRKTLTSIQSNKFERIEIHQSMQENGMAKMVQIKSLDIAREKEVVLKPGGLHLMLINPKKPIKAGDIIELTLKFNGGAKAEARALVKKSTGASNEHHSHPMPNTNSSQPLNKHSDHHQH